MAPGGRSGLTVRVSSDLGALAEDLAARLAEPIGPVLEPELVVVPTPGIGRWLESRLSSSLGSTDGTDGICANVEFRLVGDLLERLDDRMTRRGAWSVGSMTIAALGQLLAASDDGPLARLRAIEEEVSLFGVARSAADLFDQLFRWRPDVADRWLAGDDEDPRAALLRALDDVTPTVPPHRALAVVVAALARGDDAHADLPARVHLFGADTIPGGPGMVTVLDALSQVREVHLHLVAPSTARTEALLAKAPQWARHRRSASGATRASVRCFGPGGRRAPTRRACSHSSPCASRRRSPRSQPSGQPVATTCSPGSSAT